MSKYGNSLTPLQQRSKALETLEACANVKFTFFESTEMRPIPTISMMFAVFLQTSALPLHAQFQLQRIHNDIGLAKPEDVLKPEFGVYQSLPAVYRVHVTGSCKLQFPSQIDLDFDRLNQEYDAFCSAIEIPVGTPRSVVQWIQVATSPERYLRPSPEWITLQIPEGPICTGSCFAIDRNGILLTNRHVVQQPADSPLNAASLLYREPTALKAMFAELAKRIGPWTGEDEYHDSVLMSLLDWFGTHCKSTDIVTKIEIEVAYTKKATVGQSSEQLAAQMSAEMLGFDVRQATLVPARLVAVGKEGFENDIAVLQIDGEVRDSLICLSLANPDRVRNEASVYSLGFPGSRYASIENHSRDYSLVNVQAGNILALPQGREPSLKQRLKSSLIFRGYDEKLMAVSATIGSGSSGGPIVLADGAVVGINVASFDGSKDNGEPGSNDSFKGSLQNYVRESRNNMNFAVPLQRVLDFLEEHHIALDPGPRTAEWRESLVAYRNGDFTTASKLLNEIIDRQIYQPVSGAAFRLRTGSVTRMASHYVEELESIARKQIAR